MTSFLNSTHCTLEHNRIHEEIRGCEVVLRPYVVTVLSTLGSALVQYIVFRWTSGPTEYKEHPWYWPAWLCCCCKRPNPGPKTIAWVYFIYQTLRTLYAYFAVGVKIYELSNSADFQHDSWSAYSCTGLYWVNSSVVLAPWFLYMAWTELVFTSSWALQDAGEAPRVQGITSFLEEVIARVNLHPIGHWIHLATKVMWALVGVGFLASLCFFVTHILSGLVFLPILLPAFVVYLTLVSVMLGWVSGLADGCCTREKAQEEEWKSTHPEQQSTVQAARTAIDKTVDSEAPKDGTVDPADETKEPAPSAAPTVALPSRRSTASSISTSAGHPPMSDTASAPSLEAVVDSEAKTGDPGTPVAATSRPQTSEFSNMHKQAVKHVVAAYALVGGMAFSYARLYYHGMEYSSVIEQDWIARSFDVYACDIRETVSSSLDFLGVFLW